MSFYDGSSNVIVSVCLLNGHIHNDKFSLLNVMIWSVNLLSRSAQGQVRKRKFLWAIVVYNESNPCGYLLVAALHRFPTTQCLIYL